MALKVIIGGDKASFACKNRVRDALLREGYEVTDVDPEEPDHFEINALKVARGVQSGKFDRGICLCMTGMGVSIICNKFRGVYAGLCHGLFDAYRSRQINGTNVLILGGGITGPNLAEEIALTWLRTEHMQDVPDFRLEKSKKDHQVLVDVEALSFDAAAPGFLPEGLYDA